MTQSTQSLNLKVSWSQDVHNHALRLSHVRANWPTSPRGKLLTDKRITELMNQGYYGHDIIALRRLEQKKQSQNSMPAKKRAEANRKELLKLFV